jgi:hypothetical protein
MKMDFRRKNWEIGTPEYLWMRATMPIPTGGADLSECHAVIEKVTRDDDRSWVDEWTVLAESLRIKGKQLLAQGRRQSGRGAFLRSSNAFRVALMRKQREQSDYEELLTKSRETFIQAANLFEPPIEAIQVPMGHYVLPGYFVSSGREHSPTIIGTNGGDSTNEEMIHLLGFAARERGWNFIVFDGPGQYSAKVQNPDLLMTPEWELPTGAVIDWLLKRPEVDPGKIALFGWSLSANLAIRAAAYDSRISALVSNGLIVDVYEAWFGIWPKWLQRAKPRNFDRVFHLLEWLSPQVRTMTNLFYAMHGVKTPSAMMLAWKNYNVGSLPGVLKCPTLFVLGEAEYAEQSAGPLFLSAAKFLRDLKAPAWMHDFGYESGWAATHCQMGAQTALQELTLDWLEAKGFAPESARLQDEGLFDFNRVLSYTGSIPELRNLVSEVKVRAY